jgi:CxxC motif-containing protein
MEVVHDGTEVKDITGNQCKKGVNHAEKEVTFPGRVLTTTIKTDIPGIPLLPVRSNKEVPKDRLIDCMGKISTQIVGGSVKLGKPIIKDILGLGVDIVACRTIPNKYKA